MRGCEGWDEGDGGCVVVVPVAEVVVGCLVGWKEERARKAARKLERNGREGCWVGDGILGCDASLGRCDGCCAWCVVRSRDFLLYHRKKDRGFLFMSDSINESFFPFGVQRSISIG